MPFRGVIMGSIPIGNKRFFLFILRDLKTSFSFGMAADLFFLKKALFLTVSRFCFKTSTFVTLFEKTNCL